MIFKTKLIDKDKSYTFSDYFSLNIKFEVLLDFFNYTSKIETLIFKEITLFEDVTTLENSFTNIRKRVNLDSEIAKREFLIAPIIGKLLGEFQNLDISIEERIDFNNLLKGKLDYFLSTDIGFLVLEAKNENIESGLNQLAVEMITVDKIFERDNIQSDFIYGAISTGLEWKFILLNREKKEFMSDLKSYSINEDLKIILGLIIQILQLKK